MLLAVDVGLRLGLAAYAPTGRLLWYRSQHFANRSTLRRGIPHVFAQASGLQQVALEGGGPLADLWRKEAERRGMEVLEISAEVWRTALLLPRHQREGAQAKEHADTLARRIIAWSGATKPTQLRHDTAEAICLGFWAAMQAGWVSGVRVLEG